MHFAIGAHAQARHFAAFGDLDRGAVVVHHNAAMPSVRITTSTMAARINQSYFSIFLSMPISFYLCAQIGDLAGELADKRRAGFAAIDDLVGLLDDFLLVRKQQQ